MLLLLKFLMAYRSQVTSFMVKSPRAEPKDRMASRSQVIDGSMGFMVNDHLSPRAELKDKGG